MTNEQILKELDPELRPHFFQHKIAGPSVAHPLVYKLSLNANITIQQDNKSSLSLAPLVNEWLKDKRKSRDEAIRSKNWHSYVFLHERYARVDALMDCIKFNNFQMASLWELVGEVWQDTETAWSNLEQWREIWADPCPRRWRAMSRAERNALRRLPETITVWRGVSRIEAAPGMSWTLSQNQAEWFSRRWNGPDGPILIGGNVAKTDVLAYFNGRREREIVAMPESVTITQTIML